jgi:sec-independent protein translocase protein TatA
VNFVGDIFQPTHLLFIMVIALLVLGPKRIPEVGRSLGKGIRDFRQAITLDDDERDALNIHQSIADATAPLNTPIVAPPPAMAPPAAIAPAPAVVPPPSVAPAAAPAMAPAPSAAPTPPTEPTAPQS